MSSVAYRSKDLIAFNRYILREGLRLEFDVFTTDKTNPHIKSIRQGTEISAEVERYASSNSSLRLYIRPEDISAYHALLESIANEYNVGASSISGLYRDAACMQWIRDTYNDALDTRDTAVIYHSAMVNAERLIQWFDGGTSLRNVLDVLESSAAWQSVAVNTAIVCAFFAHTLGAKGNSLLELSRGSLLADIGYLDVDENALQCITSPSTDDQRKLDAHPLLGLRRLSTMEQATWVQLMMVYQHHERLDKRGFPVGIPGDQISDAAKMYCVIDRFMSLSGTKHPYTPITIYETMSKLESETGTRISKEHFQCWKSIVRSVL